MTSVGATTFLTGGTSGPEVPQSDANCQGAVNSFHSGGGMSPYFGVPDYQKDAVNHYFSTEKDLPEAHYYNRQGRGTPDVAALGIGFSVVVDGSTESVGGTSASAPTFSAVVSMLNDQQLNAGKKTLGFLNPWIYQSASKNSAAFFDVTVGNNQVYALSLLSLSHRLAWMLWIHWIQVQLWLGPCHRSGNSQLQGLEDTSPLNCLNFFSEEPYIFMLQ